MKDFSEDVAALRRRLAAAEAYLRADELRARRPQLETEASRPTSGTTPTRPARSPASWPAVVDDLDLFDRLTAERRRRRHPGRAGPGGDGRVARARDRRGHHRPVVHLRRARAAGPVPGRVRRARRGRRGPLGGRRHRLPGLGRDAGPHVPALGGAQGLQGRARGGPGRPGGGHQLGHLHGPGPPRLRLAAGRGRRPPPRPDLALRQPGPAPHGLRLGDGRARPRRGRRRDRDRREGPPHRHLPVVGGRWPARQRDRLGGAHHPPAHRAS